MDLAFFLAFFKEAIKDLPNQKKKEERAALRPNVYGSANHHQPALLGSPAKEKTALA